MTSQNHANASCKRSKTLATGDLDASSGNISLRTDDHRIFVTPSGIDYDDMEPSDLVEISLNDAIVEGNYPPSSEWPLHRKCKVRADAEMVIHSHAPFATTMACLERSIPPFHYMVALSGGVNILSSLSPHWWRSIGPRNCANSKRPSCLPDGTPWDGCSWRKYRKAIWRARRLEKCL